MNPDSSPPEQAIARLQQLRTQALFAVHRANKAFVHRGWSDPVYVQARAAIDDILLPLAEAKWLLGRLDGSNWGYAGPVDDARSAAARAQALLQGVIQDCAQLESDVRSGRPLSRPRVLPQLARRAETLFHAGTPIVPSIAPVVVLQGSHRTMGRQYVQQVVDIFGTWILHRRCALQFDADQLSELARWEQMLEAHAPRMRAFALGMMEGAASAGLSMTREQAISLWTGIRPPAREPRPMAFAQTQGHSEQVTAAYLGVAVHSETDLCSGICAWGSGTPDGSLVAGSTTDHDCTFQATIVAFPDDGHAYIYTPFSPVGFIPVLGEFHMAGHPGMNDQGMAYVHHGGANTGEPVAEWGYGLRRGPAAFHLLESCASARDALDAHRHFPVGDAGISLGTVGGLFADATYGVSIEARPGAPGAWKPILREHSFDAYGQAFDFLYANNNALAPESGHLNVPPPQGYRYTIAGGWFTRDWDQITCEPGPKAFRRLNTRNSEGRNRYAYRVMMQGYGRIDADYMTMVYRQSGEMPTDDPAEAERLWRSGLPWNSSTAHRANAFTVIMNPRKGEEGSYSACVGPANRAVEPRGPEHGYYYHDETNAFWTLRLRASPLAVLDAALSDAASAIDRASRLLGRVPAGHPGLPSFKRWIQDARSSHAAARTARPDGPDPRSDQALATRARAVRQATQAQVRARQVSDAIEPPPCTSAAWEQRRT